MPNSNEIMYATILYTLLRIQVSQMIPESEVLLMPEKKISEFLHFAKLSHFTVMPTSI